MPIEKENPLQRLPDQTPSSIRWKEELQQEQQHPQFIFRVPATPRALEKAVGLAVFFTLTDSRLIDRGLGEGLTQEQLLQELLQEKISEREQGTFDAEFAEAKRQGELAVQELFKRNFFIPYGIPYDYWQGIYKIGAHIGVESDAVTGDTGNLHIIAPVSHLAGVEGIPYHLVKKGKEWERNIRRQKGEVSPYDQLVSRLVQSNISSEQLYQELAAKVFAYHVGFVLGSQRVNEIAGEDNFLSNYYREPSVLKSNRIKEALSRADLTQTEKDDLARQTPQVVEVTHKMLVEIGDQQGIEELSFGIGVHDFALDANTMLLRGATLKELRAHTSRAKLQFTLKPKVTDATTHQGLLALRHEGLQIAKKTLEE